MTKQYNTPKDKLGKFYENKAKKFLPALGFPNIINSDSSKHPTYDIYDAFWKIKIEVKTDTNAENTGNLFIEIDDDFPNKKGNLHVSEAPIWIYNIVYWSEKLGYYEPSSTLFIDFFPFKEMVLDLIDKGDLQIKYQYRKRENGTFAKQGFVLLKATEVIPFLLDPNRLDEYAFCNLVFDDIEHDCYWFHEAKKEVVQ